MEKIYELLTQAASVEEMKKILDENGVKMTEEEFAALIKEAADDAAKNSGDELSDDSLEQVAGGIFGTLGSVLGGAWGFAVQTYGSPEKAVKGIGSYWYKKITGR